MHLENLQCCTETQYQKSTRHQIRPVRCRVILNALRYHDTEKTFLGTTHHRAHSLIPFSKNLPGPKVSFSNIFIMSRDTRRGVIMRTDHSPSQVRHHTTQCFVAAGAKCWWCLKVAPGLHSWEMHCSGTARVANSFVGRHYVLSISWVHGRSETLWTASFHSQNSVCEDPVSRVPIQDTVRLEVSP